MIFRLQILIIHFFFRFAKLSTNEKFFRKEEAKEKNGENNSFAASVGNGFSSRFHFANFPETKTIFFRLCNGGNLHINRSITTKWRPQSRISEKIDRPNKVLKNELEWNLIKTNFFISELLSVVCVFFFTSYAFFQLIWAVTFGMFSGFSAIILFAREIFIHRNIFRRWMLSNR